MSIFTEPKIDCHCHILDPVGFPYAANTPYRPAGQEIGTAVQIAQVFATYGVQNAVLVQPNSGYGEDLSAMLAAIAASQGRYKGIAVVPPTISVDELARLKPLDRTSKKPWRRVPRPIRIPSHSHNPAIGLTSRSSVTAKR